MKTNIKGTNLSLSDAITSYVDKKLKKIDKFVSDDSAIQCDVELARTTDHHNKGEIFQVDIHVVGSGKNYFARAEKEDLYTAIDDARDDIVRELKAGKAKRISVVRRSGARVKDMMRGLWPFGKKSRQ